ARSLRPAEKVVDLAAWYAEVDRHAEALDLCRRALEVSPHSLDLHAVAAQLLLARADELGLEASPALDELDLLLARAEALGESELLDAARSEARELREKIERHRREIAEQQAVAQRRAAEEKLAKLREKLTEEAKAEAAREFEQRLRGIERDL